MMSSQKLDRTDVPTIRRGSDNAPNDAAYVALAESLGVELVTLDGKIEKVPGINCTVRNPGRKQEAESLMTSQQNRVNR
jgi:hypothetical protein